MRRARRWFTRTAVWEMVRALVTPVQSLLSRADPPGFYDERHAVPAVPQLEPRPTLELPSSIRPQTFVQAAALEEAGSLQLLCPPRGEEVVPRAVLLQLELAAGNEELPFPTRALVG